MEMKLPTNNRNFKQAFKIIEDKITNSKIDTDKTIFLRSLSKVKGKYYSNKQKQKSGKKYNLNYITKCELSLTKLCNELDEIEKIKNSNNKMDTLNNNPIKYIENRAWFSCCQFNKNMIRRMNDLSFINHSQRKLQILKAENLNYRNEIKYLYSYNSFEYIEVDLNEKGLLEFNQKFLSESNNKLFSLKIRIFNFGQLNTLSYFDLFNCNDFDSLDREELALHSIVSQLNHELQTLFDLLIENGYLNKTSYLYWSVPDFVKENELTIDHSYLYQCNYFISDTAFLKSLSTKRHLSPKYFQYKDLKCFALEGQAHIFWIGAFEKERYDYLNMNFIFLSESNVYASAFLIAKTILKYINSRKSGLDYQFRHIFNYINEVILAIKTTVYQKDVYDLQFELKFGDLKEPYILYKDTERQIRYAIESIEVKKNQANERFVQNIFAIFAGLASFSFLNDIFSFLSSDKLFEPSFIYAKLGLLTTVILSISITLYLINRKFKE